MGASVNTYIFKPVLIKNFIQVTLGLHLSALIYLTWSWSLLDTSAYRSHLWHWWPVTKHWLAALWTLIHSAWKANPESFFFLQLIQRLWVTKLTIHGNKKLRCSKLIMREDLITCVDFRYPNTSYKWFLHPRIITNYIDLPDITTFPLGMQLKSLHYFWFKRKAHHTLHC